MNKEVRIIKFRGKAKENNIWLYGNIQIPSKENVGYFMWGGEYHLQYEVFPETIGQYTGLQDKNGTEIYEGDIIRSYDREGNPIIHYIHWHNSNACYVATMPQYPCICSIVTKDWIEEFEKEIIGNIHDNPELLTIMTVN